ncbi:MAG: thiamine phosphate synthase [Prevotella sp.]|nr:thiamine phosphate synthase [Prevotella sp.]
MKQIQFITHENNRFSYADGAEMALKGGCRWIQLRMKEASDADFIAVAEKIAPMCREYGATFILDDRVHLVKQCKVDGVHLGRNDMPITDARAILGSDAIIGGTANTIDDIERLWRDGANYIGCGPFRFTTTKKNLSQILGLDGYQYITNEMKQRGIQLPIVAIGGITAADIKPLLSTGIDGIAVSGAILNATNPSDEMAEFIKTLNTKDL